MYKYRVKVVPVTDHGAFAELPSDCIIELEEYDVSVEVYIITSERDISHLLDCSDGVIEYTEE